MDHPSTSTQRQAGQTGGRPRLPHPAQAARPHPRPRTAAARAGAAPAGATATGAARGRSLAAAAPAVLAVLRRLARPGHRLTGLGTAVVTTAISLFGCAADTLLFGGPGVFFGLVFTLAAAAGAQWVRVGDLAAAPISAPIAFAAALALTGGSGGGFLGHLMGTVTGLAEHAGWLYFGTLTSVAIVLVRRTAHRRAGRR